MRLLHCCEMGAQAPAAWVLAERRRLALKRPQAAVGWRGMGVGVAARLALAHMAQGATQLVAPLAAAWSAARRPLLSLLSLPLLQLLLQLVTLLLLQLLLQLLQSPQQVQRGARDNWLRRVASPLAAVAAVAPPALVPLPVAMALAVLMPTPALMPPPALMALTALTSPPALLFQQPSLPPLLPAPDPCPSPAPGPPLSPLQLREPDPALSPAPEAAPLAPAPLPSPAPDAALLPSACLCASSPLPWLQPSASPPPLPQSALQQCALPPAPALLMNPQLAAPWLPAQQQKGMWDSHEGLL